MVKKDRGLEWKSSSSISRMPGCLVFDSWSRAGKPQPAGHIWPASVFIIRLLVEHSLAHSFTHCLRWLSCYNGRTWLTHRPHGLQSLKYLLSALHRKSLLSLALGKDKGSGIYDMLKVQILTVNPQGQFLFWIICGQSGLTAWPVEH